jgi:hypothetical protein
VGGKILIAQFTKDTGVNITSPLNNSTALKNSTVLIKATASSTVSNIQKVEYYRDGGLLGTSLNAPYEFNWLNAGEGVYQIQVKAYFNNGDIKYSQINNLIVK